MTSTKVAAKTVVTTLAVELYRLLSDVSPFRGTDETLPMLTAIHLEGDDKRLLAVACDRFVLGASKVDLQAGQGSDDGFAVNLAPADVSMLLKLSKTGKRDVMARYVVITQNDDGTMEFAFNTGERLVVKPFDVEYVGSWRKLFPKNGPGVPRAATGFTPEYLAKFAKVTAVGNPSMRMFSHDDIHGWRDSKPAADGKPAVLGRGQGPVTVLIGDSFVGLIMPVKLPDDGSREWVKPEWMG